MDWVLTPPPTSPVLPVGPNYRTATYYITVPPVSLSPVTVARFRRHSFIDDVELNPDADLQDYLDAATEYAEGRLAASLMPRTIVATYYGYSRVELPRGPVIAVASVTDATGAAVPFSLENVGVVTSLQAAAAGPWPLTVTYRAGYVAADGVTPAVPADLRLAILAHAATLFENRESVADREMMPVPHTLESFYDIRRRALGVA